MKLILNKLQSKIETWREEAKKINEIWGDKVISEVTVSQAFGGMRDVISLICDTSRVPRDKGLIIREKPLKELLGKTPEEIYFLLLTGDLPEINELAEIKSELKERKEVPSYVWEVLKSMPGDSHPMTMLSTAVVAMQGESCFSAQYEKGLRKEDYWKPTLEDALNIVSKIPAIAAGIYRIKYKKGNLIEPDKKIDFSEDFVRMLGLFPGGNALSNQFNELMKIYLIAHCDHEGGNVSAFTSQTVNSTLSDLYFSISGGFNGLAGPLHGLANQECAKWLLELMKRFNGTPTQQQLVDYVWETINAGRVIPGYGHAVLRVVDPRFEGFLNFGKKYFPDDPLFKTVVNLFEIIPDQLKKIKKIKNPWPNVDAISGTILYHYGLKEFSFYTVLFAVSRSMGLTAQGVMNRAMMNPLLRPKTVTTAEIKKLVKSS
ncbi:MAG TPA: citrate (Si)-synthase [Ignavibacteriaceae bacterium]|nr:citrate (Si)-synthase [Ignavibacteriaceae bacterium]